MDRNLALDPVFFGEQVALHPEGVDRNEEREVRYFDGDSVALHPEGVDRNFFRGGRARRLRRSPSTRRAWIEIYLERKLS